jgi:hypothetical protein
MDINSRRSLELDFEIGLVLPIPFAKVSKNGNVLSDVSPMM